MKGIWDNLANMQYNPTGNDLNKLPVNKYSCDQEFIKSTELRLTLRSNIANQL